MNLRKYSNYQLSYVDSNLLHFFFMPFRIISPCLAASLDVVMIIKALKSLNFNQITRYLLRFVVAALWVIIVLGCYLHGYWVTKQSLKYAVAVYLIPNALSAILFLFPPLWRVVECSNWRIVALLFWWAQVAMSQSLGNL